jgi:hypothetical protein
MLDPTMMMACACVVCVVVCILGFWWMQRSSKATREATVAKIEARLETLDQQIPNAKSNAEAAAMLARLAPDVKVRMVPDVTSQAFWNANKGWAATFEGAPNAPVTAWAFGYDSDFFVNINSSE